MVDQSDPTGKEIIARLEKGKLPQMVDWLDPRVLGIVAIRTLISTTIGAYADQRPMQEAIDGERNAERLARRHDYSRLDDNLPGKIFPPDVDPDNPNCDPKYNTKSAAATADGDLPIRRLCLDDKGALWVDYIADLGDGFEATYAMAHLLARPSLDDVRGAERKLPAGQILIFGGDLAYPNATMEEYDNRCIDPYSWAFTADKSLDQPRRELFFVAGNHDWYDGLAAFSNQFCYETSAIGGWRCKQERSYFALQLPYRWWIWGIDVALGDSLDVGQARYFESVSQERVHQDDKIIIILHAPDWIKPHYEALAHACRIARQYGEICAIIAGDLHHYSRYESQKPRNPPMHLITSGGGGAFAHATHDRKSTLKVDPSVAGIGPVAHGHHEVRTSSKAKGTSVEFRANGHFYPTRLRSSLLSLKNLWLPFHNRGFAIFVGVVYLLYAWVFQISVADPMVALKKARYIDIETRCLADHPGDPAAMKSCNKTVKAALDQKLSALTATEGERAIAKAGSPAAETTGGGQTKTQAAKEEIRSGAEKFFDGVRRQGGWLAYFWDVMSVQFSADRVFGGMLDNPAFFLMVAGLWAGLVWWADITLNPAWIRWPLKALFGSVHTAAHLFALLSTNAVLSPIYAAALESSNLMTKVVGVALYTVLMVVIGGVLGAIVVGVYFVLTSFLRGMHAEMSFSALGIKDYKNFLRMKFDKDSLTIYPIALDKVPGRFGWCVPSSSDDPLDPKSLIAPKRPMKLRLIEAPIVITRPAGR